MPIYTLMAYDPDPNKMNGAKEPVKIVVQAKDQNEASKKASELIKKTTYLIIEVDDVTKL